MSVSNSDHLECFPASVRNSPAKSSHSGKPWHGSPSCVTCQVLAAKNDCWWNTLDVFPGFHWLWLWKLPLQQNEQLSFSVGWKLLVKAKSNELKYGMRCISWKWRWIKCGTGKVRERWVKSLTIMFYQLTLEQLQACFDKSIWSSLDRFNHDSLLEQLWTNTMCLTLQFFRLFRVTQHCRYLNVIIFCIELWD